MFSRVIFFFSFVYSEFLRLGLNVFLELILVLRFFKVKEVV